MECALAHSMFENKNKKDKDVEYVTITARQVLYQFYKKRPMGVYCRWSGDHAVGYIFCGTDRYCDWFSGGNSPLDI